MPLYDASKDQALAARIVCVKLDGKPIFQRGAAFEQNELIKRCDTDEGWVDVHETFLGEDGRKHIKMTPWRPVGKGRVRDFVVKRLVGKVEVELGEPLAAEPATIEPSEP